MTPLIPAEPISGDRIPSEPVSGDRGLTVFDAGRGQERPRVHHRHLQPGEDGPGIVPQSVSDRSLTTFDAASFATGMTPDQIEEAVRALPTASVPLLLLRLQEAITQVNITKRVATARMLEEHRTGEKWTSPEGDEYAFEQTRRGEFSDLPGLFYYLSSIGASVSDLARCATGARVTGLEALAATLPDDVRQDALETVWSHRVYREGEARLQLVENPYKNRGGTG